MNILRKILITTFATFFASSTISSAEDSKVGFGIELGRAGFDIGAKQTAQTIANLAGQAVTYTYDKSTTVGRVFIDYRLSDDFLIEAGYFSSGLLDATYTLAGASATESYTTKGLDLSSVYLPKDSALFFKAGIHSSQVDGLATITIGGTAYAANASYSGTGILIGAGFQFDNTRVGLTYYGDIGGNSNANSAVAYLGYRF